MKLWGAESLPSFPDRGAPLPYQNYFPPPGGFRFGIFTIPPAGRAQFAQEERERDKALAQWEQMFPGLLAHLEATEPGMHTSDSIDFGYVISGNVWLELDDGSATELHAGDTYIQNGTRHAWRNRGSEACSVLVVLIGTHRQPSGLSRAQSTREAARGSSDA